MAIENSLFKDSRSFQRLDVDSDGSILGRGVQFGTANDLRLGRYCLIDGFPCRIRGIQRSAPGKHGHAKLRVVGVGIFDQRKRETIFSAHQQILVPQVETRSNIVCTSMSDAGTHFVNQASKGFPDVLSLDGFGNENKPQDHGFSNVEVVAIVACGYFHITNVRPCSLSNEVAVATKKSKQQEEGEGDKIPNVLSKKEQRKQRKVLKKRATDSRVSSSTDQ